MAAVTTWVETPEPGPETAAFIEGAALTSAILDPDWGAPTRYGALMLAAMGELEAHERVLLAGVVRHPDDLWFPAALGMSHLLHRGDLESAAIWLEWASTIEGASPIYERAAQSLLRKSRSGATP